LEKIDRLFNDVLDYLYQDLTSKNPDITAYTSDYPYYILWEKGLKYIEEGFTAECMHIAIEYEKLKIIRDYHLSDSELLEVITIEKIIYCIHTGSLHEIAPMAQNFASEELCGKFVNVLSLLYEMDEIEYNHHLYLVSEENNSERDM